LQEISLLHPLVLELVLSAANVGIDKALEEALQAHHSHARQPRYPRLASSRCRQFCDGY